MSPSKPPRAPPPRPPWSKDDWQTWLWRVCGVLLIVIGPGTAIFVATFGWMRGTLDFYNVVSAAICGIGGGALGGACLWATCGRPS